MAECRLEQIAAALKARIATITVANGYLTAVAAVTRPVRLGLAAAPAHLEAVLRQGEETVPDDMAYNTDEREQTFEVELVIRPSETDTAAWETYANRFCADLRKAVATDRTFGGLALGTTRVSGWTAVVDLDQGYEAVVCTVTIPYRTKDTDPYIAA